MTGANMASGRFIAYFRVSTARQGRSGLGLEAQQESVRNYLNGGDWSLIAELVEVESGRRSDRPKLAEALRLCRLYNATLIVAKIDRLARNVAFLSNLMEAGVEFVAVDFPSANRFSIHVLAAAAEFEAKQISQRTKDALAAAKARGVRLGGDRGNIAGIRAQGTSASAKVRGDKATARAQDLGPIVRELQAAGASLGKIAAELTSRQIPTARGGCNWTSTGVKRVLDRLAA
jgi:DNA invertase Pin-like site-specific DNA recombinase